MRETLTSARNRALVSLAASVVVAVACSAVFTVQVSLLLGWVVLTVVYLTWVWLTVRNCGPEETARHAAFIDPSRITTDWLLLVSAVASLVAVMFVLVRAAQDSSGSEYAQVGLALLAVVLSWAMVHTVFMLRYARIYYGPSDSSIDFGRSGEPTYADFAYFSFTIGMTYQVSDTTTSGHTMRKTVRQQALLAYLFGTGILASAVSLVASLARS